jgi:hypothetical protein
MPATSSRRTIGLRGVIVPDGAFVVALDRVLARLDKSQIVPITSPR